MFPAARLSSKSVLRERLSAVTAEKGFHVNWKCSIAKKIVSKEPEMRLKMLEWIHGWSHCLLFLEVFRCFSVPVLQNGALLWLMKICGSNSIENKFLTLNFFHQDPPLHKCYLCLLFLWKPEVPYWNAKWCRVFLVPNVFNIPTAVCSNHCPRNQLTAPTLVPIWGLWSPWGPKWVFLVPIFFQSLHFLHFRLKNTSKVSAATI